MGLKDHKRTLIHAHNGLHTVYWTTGAAHYIHAVDLVNATLYGSLAILTVLVWHVATNHGDIE